MSGLPEVVIVGGGFGGLYAAISLRKAPVHVTLIDRRNFHLFQPLLYQVATGSLSPADIASPLRVVLKRHDNVRVIMGEVSDIRLKERRLLLTDGTMSYDTLILAPGSKQNYFNHPEWSAIAPGLKTIEDATRIRSRVLGALEAAERQRDPARVERHLTFVIVGAGATGVEMAGAVSEIARDSLCRYFRRVRNARPRVVLIEMVDRVLPSYPPALSAKAEAALRGMGVEVMTGTRLVEVADDHIVVERDGQSEKIATRTVMWTAGVLASPLGQTIAEQAGLELDRGGRVVVEPDLTVPGHPEVFVIGDLAHCRGSDGAPLPALASVAMQQGQYVASVVEARAQGRTAPPPFRYRNYGEMATIGRARAVANFGRLKLSGFVAWVLWLFVHLMKIVQFENRVLILIQWAWNYSTFNRTARLITGETPLPFKEPGQ